jgi:ubiquitin-protein ligase
MNNIAVSKEVLFLNSDLSRPRWAVEKEKVQKKFSGFSFYGSDGKITAVKGRLYTSYGNSYDIKIEIPEKYPYAMPSVSLPNTTLETDCPHKFTSENICLMKIDQWSSTLSIAFLIAKTAKWLHKYDYWKRKREWPGREQEH